MKIQKLYNIIINMKILHAISVIHPSMNTRKLENLERECQLAIKQMDERMYAREYEDDYDHILCYGISFFRKRCMVRKK